MCVFSLCLKIIYIHNVTNKTPLEICLHNNLCVPEELPQTDTEEQTPWRSRDQAPCPGAKQKAPSVKRKGRTNQELEGTIKVLHMGDIHVDEFYKQVRGHAWKNSTQSLLIKILS